MMTLWRCWYVRNEMVHHKKPPPVEVSKNFLISYVDSLVGIQNSPHADPIKGKQVVEQTAEHTQEGASEPVEDDAKEWPAEGDAKEHMGETNDDDDPAGEHEDEEEEPADPDLGLDPTDAEGLAWRDRNRAEVELEAASVRAWTDAAAAWARAGAEPAWREMPEGTVVAATVFEPSSVRERGRGGRAEVVIPDREVMGVADDTPPRAGVVE